MRDPLLGAALMQSYRAEFRTTNPPAPVQAVAFPVLAAVAKVLGRRP